MPEIILSNGQVAIVDEIDYEYLSVYNWQSCAWRNLTYAVRHSTPKDIKMHREIAINMGLYITKLKIDHRDRNGLNNQRQNLRVCTHSQNLCNQGIPVNNTSGYKGVSFCKDRNLFQAYISCKGIRYPLGRFKTEEEAALAYNKAAIRYHGEFAVLNIL